MFTQYSYWQRNFGFHEDIVTQMISKFSVKEIHGNRYHVAQHLTESIPTSSLSDSITNCAIYHATRCRSWQNALSCRPWYIPGHHAREQISSCTHPLVRDMDHPSRNIGWHSLKLIISALTDIYPCRSFKSCIKKTGT